MSQFFSETVWILTRERNPSEDVVKEAEDILVAQNISLEPLTVTDQSDC